MAEHAPWSMSASKEHRCWRVFGEGSGLRSLVADVWTDEHDARLIVAARNVPTSQRMYGRVSGIHRPVDRLPLGRRHSLLTSCSRRTH